MDPLDAADVRQQLQELYADVKLIENWPWSRAVPADYGIALDKIKETLEEVLYEH